MSDQPDDDRSGLNKEWTDSLTEMTPTEMAQAWADIASIPVKECDAKRGCANEVVWWVWFHGCESESVCDECLQMWIFEINQALALQGVIPCTDCGEEFSLLARIMKWRSI